MRNALFQNAALNQYEIKLEKVCHACHEKMMDMSMEAVLTDMDALLKEAESEIAAISKSHATLTGHQKIEAQVIATLRNTAAERKAEASKKHDALIQSGFHKPKGLSPAAGNEQKAESATAKNAAGAEKPVAARAPSMKK